VSSSAFAYVAASRDGRLHRGTLRAETAAEAATVLGSLGLSAVEIEAATMLPRGSAAPRRELSILFRNLASLVGAGLPLEHALGASVALTRGQLRAVVERARDGLRQGASLSHALDDGQGVVPAVVQGMVRAGEMAGALPAALQQIAEQMEHDAELAGRTRQALAYPALLLVAGTASVLVLVTVVLPRFSTMLEQFGGTLPRGTRALLGISGFLRAHALLLLAGTILAAGAAVIWARSADGRLTLHRWLLRAPVLGPLRHLLASARACRVMGGMLSAGLPVLAALDAGREACGDLAVAERFGLARRDVIEGARVARALENHQVLAPVTLQLSAVGDSSGQLGPMLIHGARLADSQADRAVRTAVTLLEPTLILVFGAVVLLIAGALLSAVYSLRPGL
jgi:general secretion pathway protein F